MLAQPNIDKRIGAQFCQPTVPGNGPFDWFKAGGMNAHGPFASHYPNANSISDPFVLHGSTLGPNLRSRNALGANRTQVSSAAPDGCRSKHHRPRLGPRRRWLRDRSRSRLLEPGAAMAITPSHLLASLRLGCQGQLNFRPPGPSDPSAMVLPALDGKGPENQWQSFLALRATPQFIPLCTPEVIGVTNSRNGP